MRYYVWIKNKKNEIKPILINNKKRISDLYFDIENIVINNHNLLEMTDYDFYKALDNTPNIHGLHVVKAKAIWKDAYLKYMSSDQVILLISSNLFFKYYKENTVLNTFRADPSYFLRSRKIKTQKFLKSVLQNTMKYSKKENIQLRNISYNDRISRSVAKIKASDLIKMIEKYRGFYFYWSRKNELAEYFINHFRHSNPIY